MKRLSRTLICLLICVGTGMHAQDAASEPKKSGGNLLDTAKRLLQGNKDRVSDETRKKAEEAARAAMNAVPDDIKNKAQELVKGQGAEEARKKAIQTVQGLVKGKSQESPNPAPVTETVAVARPANPAVAAAVGPQPQRLQPLVFEDPQIATPAAPTGQTVITATQSGIFDANSSTAIYRGSVKALSPDFNIACDELEIHMKKNASGNINGKPKTASDADILATRAEKKATGQLGRGLPKDSPIDMAYARGTMVTIEKNDPVGELQIAHCNEVAIFDGKTGVFTLRGWPSVQKGDTIMEATDPRCFIIIDSNGKLTADGGAFRTTRAATPQAAPPSTSTQQQ
ncbi:MAG: hypothetical protein IPK32_17360 [Verrucomicrobiaceae bacterium]|nr:hypothetical protein [Verrucomicrobiaceae bacterium]